MEPIDRLPDKYLMILRTLRSMFAVRGYDVDPAYEAAFASAAAARGHCTTAEDNVVLEGVHRDDAGSAEQRKIIVYYLVGNAKVGKPDVDGCIRHLDARPNARAFLVYKKLTPYAQQPLQDRRLEAFQEEEVVVNPTEHKLYMPHSEVTGAEERRVRKQYKGGVFPSLEPTDRICKFFGWPKGTLVKIERKYGTDAERLTYYRQVK